MNKNITCSLQKRSECGKAQDEFDIPCVHLYLPIRCGQIICLLEGPFIINLWLKAVVKMQLGIAGREEQPAISLLALNTHMDVKSSFYRRLVCTTLVKWSGSGAQAERRAIQEAYTGSPNEVGGFCPYGGRYLHLHADNCSYSPQERRISRLFFYALLVSIAAKHYHVRCCCAALLRESKAFDEVLLN